MVLYLSILHSCGLFVCAFLRRLAKGKKRLEVQTKFDLEENQHGKF